MVKSSFHLYFRSSYHFILCFAFLSRVKMNLINWPAPNIWVFIAQLVEHCSANAEAMGSNPVEALKFFSGLNLQLPKLQLQLRWSNLHFICISAVHITSFYVSFLSRVKMNSINWPVPNIWVFIAQLVEHCSANAEAIGSNPVKALKFFSGLNLQLPKFVFPQFISLHSMNLCIC